MRSTFRRCGVCGVPLRWRGHSNRTGGCGTAGGPSRGLGSPGGRPFLRHALAAKAERRAVRIALALVLGGTGGTGGTGGSGGTGGTGGSGPVGRVVGVGIVSAGIRRGRGRGSRGGGRYRRRGAGRGGGDGRGGGGGGAGVLSGGRKTPHVDGGGGEGACPEHRLSGRESG